VNYVRSILMTTHHCGILVEHSHRMARDDTVSLGRRWVCVCVCVRGYINDGHAAGHCVALLANEWPVETCHWPLTRYWHSASTVSSISSTAWPLKHDRTVLSSSSQPRTTSRRIVSTHRRRLQQHTPCRYGTSLSHVLSHSASPSWLPYIAVTNVSTITSVIVMIVWVKRHLEQYLLHETAFRQTDLSYAWTLLLYDARYMIVRLGKVVR